MSSLVLILPLLAQNAASEGVTRIPAPGGEVVLANTYERQGYEEIHYAPVRRVGDTVFVSGVIAGPPAGKVADPASYRAQVEKLFEVLGTNLAAAGTSLSNVVKINSFHVWNSPHFKGSQEEHFNAFSAAKDKFIPAPYPAWTAVGTTGLLSRTGLVEVEVIAVMPDHSKRAGK